MSKINVRNRNQNTGRSPNWEYRFEAAKIDGKRKSISKAGFHTKKEALEAGTQALVEYSNTGQKIKKSEISVADFFKMWYQDYVVLNVRLSTCTNYKGYINNYIIPALGQYKMKDVDSLTLQKFMNDIVKQGTLCRQNQKHLLGILTRGFGYAKKVLQIIHYNPALEVEIPKQNKKQKNKYLPTKEDIEKLLDYLKPNPPKYYGVLIAYYTGMRIAEVYGLTWDCVDFENKTIAVKHIVKKYTPENINFDGKNYERSKWCLGECKSASSARLIHVGDSLLNALKEWKAYQDETKRYWRNEYYRYYLVESDLTPHEKVFKIVEGYPSSNIIEEANFVLTQTNGKYSGVTLGNEAQRDAKKILGSEFHFHLLRKLHATQLFEAGASPKDVQERLGHSKFQLTMDVYVKNTEAQRLETAKLFERTNSILPETVD